MNDLTHPTSPANVMPPVPGPMSLAAATQFERSVDSPFPDQYSVEREKVALRDLLASDDPNPMDPRYPRLELLEERERALSQMQSAWRLRSGAELSVPDNEAMRMRELGSLENEAADTMALHTKEGFRLFMGRSRDTEGKYDPIIGGKRIASSLKALWFLSGSDNPYADWALLRNTQSTDDLRQLIEKYVTEYKMQMDSLAARGLMFSVLRSAEPKTVELGFKSPYGYAMAELIVDYDYFVRLVKTLVRKNRFSDVQGQDVIRMVTRKIRASFEEVARFERYLMKPELRPLSRADFLPHATGDAARRVEAVMQIYGAVPADIFTGKLAPRHSKRRVKVSEEELALLQRIAAGQELEMAEGKGRDDEASLV